MACNWYGDDPLMKSYHDTEWGVPVYDDRLWFEYILLDGFQAGLSWKTVLHKREGFREAFENFQPEKVVNFTDERLAQLQQNPKIIRNKLKIAAARKNAAAFLKLQEKHGSFSSYIWQFTEGEMKVNHLTKDSDFQATSKESDAMSKALKKEGFSFVGSTICYAFMQAAGMVNDHLVTCKRHKEVQDLQNPNYL